MSVATELSAASLRPAIEAISEEAAHHGTEPPEPSLVYVVPGHESALNPDKPLVVGDRGTGKSFWSAALNGEVTRMVIGRQIKRLRLDKVRVGWGYSSEMSNQKHPSRRVLGGLLDHGFRAEDIWRTVILYQLTDPARDGFFQDADTWHDRAQRVADDPERFERTLAQIDDSLKAADERYLIVFDALDRLGEDWGQIRPLMQGLLRVSLDLKDYRAIRAKLFLRPDMWEDPSIWAFPDASKLTHGRVLLEWHRADLYALLWHHLGNDPSSGWIFRKWLAETHGKHFEPVEVQDTTIHVVPEALRTHEATQAEVLKAIASAYMGRDRRRGKTYTWLPTHLADAKGQISPRSFLVAIKQAFNITEREHPDAEALLHYEGIKRGVQEASRIRLAELREDYPWIQELLRPLGGMTVPTTADELRNRWHEHSVLDSIEQQAAMEGKGHEDSSKPYLLPQALETLAGRQRKEDALIEAALEIGVMSRTSDGRLNIPDLFRVAADIGHRGGVRDIR